MKKKRLSIALAFSLLFGTMFALTGCGKDKTAAPDAAGQSSGPTKVTLNEVAHSMLYTDKSNIKPIKNKLNNARYFFV